MAKIDDATNSSRINRLKEAGKTKSVEDVVNKTRNVQYPQVAEPAMQHPLNTSTIKIRDNGMIDFFVDKDHGMRLDPNTYTWNLIINGEKHHADYIRGWVTQTVQWDVGRSWIMNLGTDLIIKAGGNMTFSATGNINFDVGGNISSNAGNTISSNAGSIISLNAGNIYIN